MGASRASELSSALEAATRSRNASQRARALALLESLPGGREVREQVIPALAAALAQKIKRADGHWAALSLARVLVRLGRGSKSSAQAVRAALKKQALDPEHERVQWILEGLDSPLPQRQWDWTGPDGGPRFVHTLFGRLTWKIDGGHPNEDLQFQTVEEYLRDGVLSVVISADGHKSLPAAVLRELDALVGRKPPKRDPLAERLAEIDALVRSLAPEHARCDCQADPRAADLEEIASEGSYAFKRCRACGRLYTHHEESEWMGFYRDETDTLSPTTPKSVRAVLEDALDHGRAFAIVKP